MNERDKRLCMLWLMEFGDRCISLADLHTHAWYWGPVSAITGATIHGWFEDTPPGYKITQKALDALKGD